MSPFLTPARRRVLRYYWKEHTPFSAYDLTRKDILSDSWAPFTLYCMEQRRQIRPYDVVRGSVRYIATTESKEEWKMVLKSGDKKNRYEDDDFFGSMYDVLENWKKERETDDQEEHN